MHAFVTYNLVFTSGTSLFFTFFCQCVLRIPPKKKFFFSRMMELTFTALNPFPGPKEQHQGLDGLHKPYAKTATLQTTLVKNLAILWRTGGGLETVVTGN